LDEQLYSTFKVFQFAYQQIHSAFPEIPCNLLEPGQLVVAPPLIGEKILDFVEKGMALFA